MVIITAHHPGAGAGYAVGDTIAFLGTAQAVQPANDVTITVDSVSDDIINSIVIATGTAKAGRWVAVALPTMLCIVPMEKTG